MQNVPAGGGHRETDERLAVFYVPGLDRRWLSAEVTPFLSGVLERYRAIDLQTHPSVELLPTIVSGVWPGEHKVWQVRLRDSMKRTWLQRVVDACPDRVSTAVQCVRHRLDTSYDLPTVEPRRRRRFEMHRLKVQRRHGGGMDALDLGGLPTVFSQLEGDARYHTIFQFDDAADALAKHLDGAVRLDLIELYALDLFAHWNLDRPEAMRETLQRTDALLEKAYNQARRHGLMTVLLVDHGQEKVTGQIDLLSVFKTAGVPRAEYDYYIEVCNARLWFHTQRAERVLRDRLSQLERCQCLTNDELAAYHVHFDRTEGFGDLYVFSDPGMVFFPHDLYHPLVNAYMARKTPEQQARRRSGVHRGYHGYLPGGPADTGYLVPMDDAVTHTLDEGERADGRRGALVDVAPTVLGLLGQPAADTMRGRVLLTHRGRA